MGLFGGSSQSTSSIVSTIDFSPVMQFGADQNSTQDKINRQEATVSPIQKDEGWRLNASAGVAWGKNPVATGGPVAEGENNLGTKNNTNFIYLAIIGVAFFILVKG